MVDIIKLMDILSILGILLLVSSSAVLFCLIFVYRNNYRFATLIFDLLPYYPVLFIFGASLLIISFILLKPSMLLFISVLPLLVVYGYYCNLFLDWRSNYRLKHYDLFLQSLTASNDVIITSFEKWLENPVKNNNKTFVIIRHDVDITLNRAKLMYDIERKNNVTSCYLFRNNAERYTFSEVIPLIKEISSNGFEIGFHYETITNSLGDVEKAGKLFVKELTDFRKIAPIKIIAAHGDKFRNDRLVNENLINLEELGITSAYHIGYDIYISEAGGNHHFLRNDRIVTISEELNNIFSKKGQVIEILIHPDWWF